MNRWLDEPAWPRESHVVERLEKSIGGLLFRTLTEKYAIPADEAEALLRMVMLSPLFLEVRIKDPEAWLIAATCNSARRWHRQRALDDGLPVPLPDAFDEDIRALRGVVFAAKALAAIPENGRVALHLRFRQQWSYAEIAAELGVTNRYAETLVARSLARLREIQRGQR